MSDSDKILALSIWITDPEPVHLLDDHTLVVEGRVVAGWTEAGNPRDWNSLIGEVKIRVWVDGVTGIAQIGVPDPEYPRAHTWSKDFKIAETGELTIRATATVRWKDKDEEELAESLISLVIPDEPFASWFRLEPSCRSADFSPGLQARTADPLWMLARQWQTGEFHGEDTGSPYSVTVRYATQEVDQVRLGEEEPSLPDLPLEMLVERECLDLDWRTRVQIGQRFERAIQKRMAGQPPQEVAETIEAYRQEYSLDLPTGDDWVQTDRASRGYIRLVAGRVVDGKQLLKDVFLPPPIPLPGHRVPARGRIQNAQLNRAVIDLRKWCLDLGIGPEATRPLAWRTQQLDYRFELNPPQPGTPDKPWLLAPSYRSGELDWYTFNAACANKEMELGGEWDEPLEVTTFPARISAGGTSPRWWAFEDAATDFGRMDVEKVDLARLILMEFVLIYGDDWFYVPLPVSLADSTEGQLPRPRLARVESVAVRTVFNEELFDEELLGIPIPSAQRPDPSPLRRWEVFTLSMPPDPARPWIGDPYQPGLRDGADDVVLIVPAAGHCQESPPIEEVRFLRDEGANMVWAVEHTVPGGLGLPVDGSTAQQERRAREREARIAALQKRLVQIAAELAAGGLSPYDREKLEAEAAEKRDEIERLRSGRAPVRSDATGRYRLATEVPDNWIPFVPAQSRLPDGSTGVRLRRAQMLSNVDEGVPAEIRAQSRLLALVEDPLLWPPEMEEATIPRSGLWVQLAAQRTRWFGGKTYVWLGRKVWTGRGEGSSGLRFDVLMQQESG